MSSLNTALRNYTDAAIAGLSWKQAVRVATTANITLSGLQSIDGYTTIAGDRVLVKNQSTATQNGIYIASAGAWTRATDSDNSAEFESMAMYVSTGTTNKTTGWVLSNEGVITLNTTNLAYAQFSGNGSYTAGNGITISGNSIAQTNVGTAGTYTKVTTDAMGNVISGTGATTADIAENASFLYFTDARARSALSVSGLPLTYNSTTGVFGINQATSGTAGYLSAADWTTFNNKYGSVTSTG